MALIAMIQGADGSPVGGGGVGLIELVYMAAAFLFVFGIKRLGRVRTAQRGNQIAALGMLLARTPLAGLLLRVDRALPAPR